MLDHETDPEEDAREAPSSPARWQMTPDGLRYYPANEVVPIAVTDTPFVYAAKLVHPDTNERWLVLRYDRGAPRRKCEIRDFWGKYCLRTGH